MVLEALKQKCHPYQDMVCLYINIIDCEREAVLNISDSIAHGSLGSMLRIPAQRCQLIQTKAATDSGKVAAL
jgi:hypothetical protein